MKRQLHPTDSTAFSSRNNNFTDNKCSNINRLLSRITINDLKSVDKTDYYNHCCSTKSLYYEMQNFSPISALDLEPLPINQNKTSNNIEDDIFKDLEPIANIC